MKNSLLSAVPATACASRLTSRLGRLIARALPLALIGVCCLSVPSNPLHADRIVTVDKRIINVLKARAAEGGGYTLTFENGIVHCPEDQVVSVSFEGDMSDYVPANDKERELLEKGHVRYNGRWMSKRAYQAELNREAKERDELLAELEAHSEFHDGWVKESKHFIVRTNTSPELLEYYSDLLEAYYSLMDKRVGISPTPKLRRTKMKVNIYKSRAEFTEISGTSPGVAGYFSFQAESLNFYHDYEDPTVSDWIALHECTHLLTYLIEPQSWPRIWVNEGVADYFGSSTITTDKRGRISIEPGKLQLDRILTVQQAIEEGTYVPLETLFRTEKSEFQAFQYAHSWSFVYFLNNSDYAKGFNKFFEKHYTIPKGVEYTMEPFPNQQGTAKILTIEEVRRLLLESLKIKDDEVGELEAEWLAFITAIEIDAPQARFKRAYKVVRSGESESYEQALEDLDFAIEAGLREPRAYWCRAMLKYREADVAGAETDFREAIAMAPLDPRFRFSLAGLLAGTGVTMGGGSTFLVQSEEMTLRGSKEEIEEARVMFGLSHEMAPTNESYRMSNDSFLDAYDRWLEEEG
ncbi:MAG: hypothetical protein ACI8PQ_001412 [Planctomycetota bacterium]|jgi:hypothetical protein